MKYITYTIFIFCFAIVLYFLYFQNNHVQFNEPFVTKTNEIIPSEKKVVEKIPKIIIQLWKTWSSKRPEMFSDAINRLKQKNPSFEYKFFRDDEIDNFLKHNYPEYYETFNTLPLNIQKVDFFRYVAIYHYGGFYFDLDIDALEPLDDLLGYDCVFPVDEIITPETCSVRRFNFFCKNNIHFLLGQYGLAASPKNPFIKTLIESIKKNVNLYVNAFNINSVDYVYATTGPDFVTNEYMNYHDKDKIHILHHPERQHFGKYAKHNYVGTWKQP